jgi:G3E family GTPase
MENNMKPNLYLINGPLGAGKTTFLRELLKLPKFQNARVIENEFASTSVDTEQLHDHQAEVSTIAGVCICCSTGDELTDALTLLATSNEPVVIEATGVANSLKLIEKIVVADMLEKYTLRHAVFILDAIEAISNSEIITTYTHELKAADTVLISKTDLLSESQLSELMKALEELSLRQMSFVRDGVFDKALLQTESRILHYFMELDEAIDNHDAGTNYTIIDSADITFDATKLESIWSHLKDTYGIQRMKGNIVSVSGEQYHIEATPAQCRLTEYTQGVLRLVLIGTDARSVTKSVLEGLL